MTFLQPLILFALPLIGLPILIHLVNQNRHRTVHWAATMFLLQAKRMARGMARLRYWLIMLARMLAVAGLVFAVSRPMAGGWLGLTAGGFPETTIIVLDRSLSMETHDPGTRQSKRSTALTKLIDLIDRTGRNTQLVLFDSVSDKHQIVDTPADLLDLPQTSPTDTTADIPGLVQRAAEFIATNETGRTDVWIASDLRKADWNPAGGRWEAIRKQLETRDGVRLYLLAYPDQPADNFSVSVSGVHRRETMDGAELVMDIRVNRSGASSEPVEVPLSFVIDGARSRLAISVIGSEFIRNGHAIPIDRESVSGWGRIELPDDANSADNIYRFVYAEPPSQKTVVVSDNPSAAEFLRLAAATSTDRLRPAESEIVTVSQAAAIDWKQTAMVIWQAPLPKDVLAEQLEDFVASGRTVLFYPPELPDSSRLFGCGWTDWKVHNTPSSVARWRTETDLFGNTRNGSPLPVGELRFNRSCGLETERASVLASLDGGIPLLVRAATDQGAAWFCGSLPGARNSTFVDNGVVFYVMIQRALAQGAAALGSAQNIDCGTLPESAAVRWKPLDVLSKDVLVSRRTIQSGIYDVGDVRYALNRPLVEDDPTTLSGEALEELFAGLNFTRVDDSAGSTTALASEIWRTFLILMIIALLAEALLSLPDRRPSSGSTDTPPSPFARSQSPVPVPVDVSK